jgi:hypothetical protein
MQWGRGATQLRMLELASTAHLAEDPGSSTVE